jgi:ABC-2 type transport system permease protein
MNRMRGYHQFLEKELVEAWRTSRIIVVGGLFLVLGIASPLVTYFLPDIIRAFAPAGFAVDVPPLDVSDVLDQLLKNLVQFGALAAILVTMGSVANEKERGTAAFALAKPVARTAFLAAKLVAIAMVFFVAIALAVAGAWVYTAILWDAQPLVGWVQLGLVAWLSAMVYAAITFLGSTLARSSLAAAGFGFAALIVLSLASVVPSLQSWLPAGLTAVAKALALGDLPDGVDPVRTISVSLALGAVAVALAAWRFGREEL